MRVRGGYVTAATALVGGLGLAALILFRQLPGIASGLQQVVVPGDHEIVLAEAGTHTIFHEERAIVGGRYFASDRQLNGLKLRLQAVPSGDDVPIGAPSARTSYSLADREGSSIGTFNAARPGRYRLRAWYPDAASDPAAVLAIGQGVERRLMMALLGSLASGLAGLLGGAAIVGITYRRGRRERKDKQAMKTASAILFSALFLVPTGGWAQPVETELAGVTAELLELRQSGGVLRLAVRFANNGTDTADFDAYEVSRLVLVNAKSKKKHLPIKDANDRWVAGPILDDAFIRLRIPARQSTVVWAYFEPVTVGDVMNVEIPHVFPFENVPVTEGPGKVFASNTARTTPGGGVATVVSAKRGDQVLNVRLRLAPEKGEADLLDAYLRYKHVFLFDPAAKRKYPLVIDTEGDFQAQPIQVQGDGGSFVYDWRKTTLVSLTFQAPPDTVQRADLMLPQFLPFEGVAIEGLGGAAEGGVAAAGKTLGLEGALKELKAEVTATEIKIDLAADVLFDFDKAEIKKQAEPALQNLATVLKANPGAKVAIEGHTDGRGADDYNQKLSEARAASVKQWLVTNAQVEGANIATRGWGKTKPVAHNTRPDGSDDPEGRAKNRRVEIVVRKG